jgi:hypothetical protein
MDNTEGSFVILYHNNNISQDVLTGNFILQFQEGSLKIFTEKTVVVLLFRTKRQVRRKTRQKENRDSNHAVLQTFHWVNTWREVADPFRPPRWGNTTHRICCVPVMYFRFRGVQGQDPFMAARRLLPIWKAKFCFWISPSDLQFADVHGDND